MSGPTLVNLDWFESQAIHCWRAAGYNQRQISEGMNIGRNTVKSVTYTHGAKARASLSKLAAWAGYFKEKGAVRPVRKLTPEEAEAVVLWLEVGFARDEVAEAMCMTLPHVGRFADKGDRKTLARKRLEERVAFAPCPVENMGAAP